VGTLRLTLLRHGQAQAADSCPDDFERVLTRRGAIEAKEMATRIVHRDLIPDLILTSPAERAWATASIVAGICELEGKQVRCARELYLATPETTWRVLTERDLGVRHLMVCGHNPGLSQVASRLGPKPQPRDLPTGGIVSAIWSRTADWTTLQPETASLCVLDDPESMADLWA
jgi:phosphohistidine phosphatase